MCVCEHDVTPHSHQPHACVLVLMSQQKFDGHVGLALRRKRREPPQRALCGSEARWDPASLLCVAMSGEQVLQQPPGILQSQQQLAQSIPPKQQQESTNAQQHESALLMQCVQTINERSASEGIRENNRFLDNKSGAKPVMWAGESAKYAMWEAKLAAHFSMIGDKRVGDWVKWIQVQNEPITSDSVGPWLRRRSRDGRGLYTALHSE